MGDATHIMESFGSRTTHTSEELLPIVYDELRSLAAQKLTREKPGQTLQATALVHEAYLRLVGSTTQEWESCGHFFAAAAEAMRRILVDNARRKKTVKHGGDLQRAPFDSVVLASADPTIDILALNDALDELARERPTHAELVKLRYFAGLTGKQAASALGISDSTADRYWSYARSWLRLELTGGEASTDA